VAWLKPASRIELKFLDGVDVRPGIYMVLVTVRVVAMIAEWQEYVGVE
jgi:hypothetical protein